MKALHEHEFEAAPGLPEKLPQGERILWQGAPDALALARAALVPVDPTAAADDIYASIYRDEAAADAWLASNLEHNGYPALARVPLPDGRVVGILDLRTGMKHAKEENK